MTAHFHAQADLAIGLVVEGTCPLCKAELRIHDGRACCTCCGDSYTASPGGVVVRMSGPKRDRFAELVFEGSIVATKESTGLRLRRGDVEVHSSGNEIEVRIRRR